jgi:hypothetical protein
MMSANDRERLARDGYCVIRGVSVEDLLVCAKELGLLLPDPRD